MNFVKVSLFQKILIFLINLVLLINILIISVSPFYSSHGENLFFIWIYLLNILTFFYILKNKLLAIKIYWILILLNFYIIYWIIDYIITIINDVSSIWYSYFDAYIFFIVVFILFISYLLYDLYLLHKNIKKWVENIKEKLVTSKKQEKAFIVISITSIILLIVFRFWYYDKEKDILEIDKSYYVTKYQNLDIPVQDNLYIDLKNFKYEEFQWEKRYLKEEIVNCLYKNICFPLGYYKDKIAINKGTLIDTNELKRERFKPNCNYVKVSESINEYRCNNSVTDEKKIKMVKYYLNNHKNILYEFKDEKGLNKTINDLINTYSKKKYFKSNINKGMVVYTGLIWFNRDLQYKVLYYLNNKEENKAIELLDAQIDTSLTMLDWDTSLISILVAVTNLWISLDNLDIILNNFSLTEKSKEVLKNTLSKKLDYSAIFEDMFKSEHNYKILTMFDTLPSNTTLYNHDYTFKWFFEVEYYMAKNKWEIPENIISKYEKINYFQKNILWQIIWKNGYRVTYKSQYNKLVNVDTKIESLLSKINTFNR